MYAGDGWLISNKNCIKSKEYSKSNLNKLNYWFQHSLTKILHFYNVQKTFENIEIIFNNSFMNFHEDGKFLGLNIKTNLNWRREKVMLTTIS